MMTHQNQRGARQGSRHSCIPQNPEAEEAILAGNRLLTKSIAPEDAHTAFQYYASAAELGHAEALFMLGVCYQNGISSRVDLGKAVEFYRKSSDKGCLAAMFNLAECLKTGCGVEKNESEAAELFQKAAERGMGEAQYQLSWMYSTGRGVPKNLETSFYWASQATDSGFYLGPSWLATYYLRGIVVKRNIIYGLWLALKGMWRGIKFGLSGDSDTGLTNPFKQIDGKWKREREVEQSDFKNL